MTNKRNFAWHFIYILLFYTILSFTQTQAFCGNNPLALQILGSGGPIADDSRASSGYLLWINGKSRLMVDAGGGTFLRFGEAKARIEDLNLLAISHFHTDHVSTEAQVILDFARKGNHKGLPLQTLTVGAIPCGCPISASIKIPLAYRVDLDDRRPKPAP